MFQVKDSTHGVVFKVRVSPRSGRSEVAGIVGESLRLKLAAPPVAGKANDECRRLLAEVLGVKGASVEILSGLSSRNKLVRVAGISSQYVIKALNLHGLGLGS